MIARMGRTFRSVGPSVALAAALSAALGAGGCRPAPPLAPDELDDLIHFFFQEIDGGDADALGAGAVNLEAWYDGADDLEDGWSTGRVSDLADAEIAALDMMTHDPDPSLASGVYILLELDCSLEEVLEIYLEPDQLALFPGTYDDYQRTFDSDPDCFVPGSCDRVDWHSTIEDSIVGLAMSYDLVTRLVRFRYDDPEGEGDQVVVGRNVMPAPAEEAVAGAGFEQSYHIEAYVPRGSNRTLHLYGLWNYGYLDGVPDDASFWPNQYRDGLIEWDERIFELCADGW